MEALLILLVAGMCTGLPLWMGGRFGVLPYASPMHILGYFCLFGFLVKVAVYVVSPELAFFRHFAHAPWALPTGALYLASFIFCMCLGYRLAIRPDDPIRPTLAPHLVVARLRWVGALTLLAFVIAGLTLALMLQARGISGTMSETLTALNTDKQIAVNAQGVGATLAGLKTLFVVPKLVFVLALARAICCPSPRNTCLAGVLAALLVGIALITGDRFELVELMLIAAATYGLMGGRARAGVLWTAALAFVALVIVSAYMTTLRGAEGGLARQIVASTYFLDINVAAIMTDRVAPGMYLWGESYGWWSFGWIPRTLWVDKPAIDLGVYFKRDVLGVPTGGAFNVTGPGEAFLNFGWWGIAVGGVLGGVYRRAEVWLLQPDHCLRFGSFLYYPLLLSPFVQASLQSSFSGFIVGATAQGAVIAGIIWLTIPRFCKASGLVRGDVHVA